MRLPCSASVLLHSLQANRRRGAPSLGSLDFIVVALSYVNYAPGVENLTALR